MLRDPGKSSTTVTLRKDKATGRFRIEPLEERIAPRCQTNPQGRKVGNCGRAWD
jgi:hypothetical protein